MRVVNTDCMYQKRLFPDWVAWDHEASWGNGAAAFPNALKSEQVWRPPLAHQRYHGDAKRRNNARRLADRSNWDIRPSPTRASGSGRVGSEALSRLRATYVSVRVPLPTRFEDRVRRTQRRNMPHQKPQDQDGSMSDRRPTDACRKATRLKPRLGPRVAMAYTLPFLDALENEQPHVATGAQRPRSIGPTHSSDHCAVERLDPSLCIVVGRPIIR